MSSFQDSFTALACHLFPDGCPDVASPGARSWPKRNWQDDVKIYSSKEASACIHDDLPEYASKYGLNADEMHCVTVAACALLPVDCVPSVFYAQDNSPSTGGVEHVMSRLLMGDQDKLFSSLMRRCMLPKPCRNDECIEQTMHVETVELLLYVCSSTSTGDEGKCVLCRLMYLLIEREKSALACFGVGKNQYKRNNFEPVKKLISSFYSVIFSMVGHLKLRLDAARLLYVITERRHIVKHRVEKLRLWFGKGRNLNNDDDILENATLLPILMLLSSYEKLQPAMSILPGNMLARKLIHENVLSAFLTGKFSI